MRTGTGLLAATGVASLSYMLLQLRFLPALKQCVLSRADTATTGSISPGEAAACVNGTTLASAALLVVALAGLLVLLWRNAERLERLFRMKRAPLLALLLIVAALSIMYLAQGDVTINDAAPFIALSQYMHESLRDGTLPFWNFYWNGGSSVFAFYGFLGPLMAALLQFVTNDAHAAAKAYLFVLHIAGSLFTFLLVEKLTGSKKAAFLSAFLYAVSAEHIGRIMMGRMRTALLYALLPLLLLTFERFMHQPASVRNSIIVALAAGAVFFANQGDALFLLFLFAAYAATRILFAEEKRKRTAAMACSAALFLLLTAFWSAPFVLEKDVTSASGKVTALISLHSPQLTLLGNAVTPLQTGFSELYSLGIIVLALSAVATVLAWKQKKRELQVLAATAGLAFLLILVQEIRYASLLVLLLSILAGAGVVMLAPIMEKRGMSSSVLLLVIAALSTAEFFPALMQNTYVDTTYERDLHRQIAEDTGDFRVMDLHSNRRTFWPSRLYTNARLQTVFNPVIEASPRSAPYAAAIAQRAAQELYDQQDDLSATSAQGMYLLNTRYVIVHESQKGKNAEETFRDKRAGLGLERNMRVLALPASPAVAAQQAFCCYTSSLDSAEPWFMREQFEQRRIEHGITDDLILQMNIDTALNTADAILLKEGKNRSIPAEQELKLVVGRANTTAERVELTLHLTAPAIVQLSYAYYPWLRVTVDGEEKAYRKTAMNMIAVEMEEGMHTVVLTAEPSPLRKKLMGLSGITLLMAAGMIALRKKTFL